MLGAAFIFCTTLWLLIRQNFIPRAQGFIAGRFEDAVKGRQVRAGRSLLEIAGRSQCGQFLRYGHIDKLIEGRALGYRHFLRLGFQRGEQAGAGGTCSY